MLAAAVSLVRSASLAAPAALPSPPLVTIRHLASPLTLQIGLILPNIVIVIIGIKGINRTFGQSWNGRRAVGHARFVARVALPVAVRPARS